MPSWIRLRPAGPEATDPCDSLPTTLGIKVVLDQIGSVENMDVLTSLVSELDLGDAVAFHGQLSHGEVLELMAAADIFFLTQPGTVTQVPSKLFEMLSFARPIVALTEPGGATASVIEGYSLGTVLQTPDCEAIASVIRRYANVGVLHTHSDDLKKALKTFDGRDLTGQLAELLGGCVR